MQGYYTYRQAPGYIPVYMTEHGGLQRKQDLKLFDSESKAFEDFNKYNYDAYDICDFRFYEINTLRKF